jgi:hypothetical protein
MSRFLRFLELVTGRKSRKPSISAAAKQPISDDEMGVILSSMALSEWADVEYYGPGAAEAEARRAASLGLMPKDEPQAVEKKKRQRK